MSQRFSARRLATATTGSAAAVLVSISVAWACTVVSGSTFYSDGTKAKSGPVGTRISAYAVGAYPTGWVTPLSVDPPETGAGQPVLLYLKRGAAIAGASYFLWYINSHQISTGMTGCGNGSRPWDATDGPNPVYIANGDGEITQFQSQIPPDSPPGVGRFVFQNSANGPCTTPPLSVTTSTTRKRCEPPFRGYLYRDSKPDKLPDNLKGCVRHHMPSHRGVALAGEEGKSWSYDCGPVIMMHPTDHLQTGSAGGRKWIDPATPGRDSPPTFRQNEAAIIQDSPNFPAYRGPKPTTPARSSTTLMMSVPSSTPSTRVQSTIVWQSRRPRR